MEYLSQESVLQKMALHFSAFYTCDFSLSIEAPCLDGLFYERSLPKLILAFKTPAISLIQLVETLKWTRTLVDSSAGCHLKP